MSNPLPGSNPYLEQPDYRSDFQNQLVAEIARSLIPQVLPNCRVVMDKWVYKMTVEQAYLEVKDAAIQEVITAIEVLSPANKTGEGRAKYEAKRQAIVGSKTHLVEIDLLRSGQPLTLEGEPFQSHYKLLVSRAQQRPQADLYPFNLADSIPSFPVP